MDKLRQSIFSSLGNTVEDTRVLDLFAGTGSYGLEALSRGAASAVFVEKNRKACEMIKENAKIVAKSMEIECIETKAICADALKFKYDGEPFDLVFVDPPYEIIESIQGRLFSILDRHLSERGTVVFEMPGHINLESGGWKLDKRLGKGSRQPTGCFYKRK